MGASVKRRYLNKFDRYEQQQESGKEREREKGRTEAIDSWNLRWYSCIFQWVEEEEEEEEEYELKH